MNRVFVPKGPLADNQQILGQTRIVAKVIPYRLDEKATGLRVLPVAIPCMEESCA
jgi:hypothetical protein